jgi:hypothetical protein
VPSANADAPAFASTVADALIGIGVRCVVAAGWAVDDTPAEQFATTFYRALLARRPFIDAVCEARKAAYDADPHGKTWAAYQCYGDPNWIFRGRVGDSQASTGPVHDEYEEHCVARGAGAGAGRHHHEAAAHGGQGRPGSRRACNCWNNDLPPPGAPWVRWPKPLAWPGRPPAAPRRPWPGTNVRWLPATPARH